MGGRVFVFVTDMALIKVCSSGASMCLCISLARVSQVKYAAADMLICTEGARLMQAALVCQLIVVGAKPKCRNGGRVYVNNSVLGRGFLTCVRVKNSVLGRAVLTSVLMALGYLRTRSSEVIRRIGRRPSSIEPIACRELLLTSFFRHRRFQTTSTRQPNHTPPTNHQRRRHRQHVRPRVLHLRLGGGRKKPAPVAATPQRRRVGRPVPRQ